MALFAAGVFGFNSASAQLPAFPGADGAGGLATGGRGGVVYHVTKLDQNYSDAGEGTLRYGLNDANFTVGGVVQPRTIVFDVGGTFWLGRFGADRGHDNGWDTQSRLNLGSHVTIAGQTAPGGVTIMGGVLKANGDNLIMRNVTVAPGYGLRNFAKPDEGIEPTPGDFPDSYVYDALDISGTNMVFDHLTALYATDETVSANEEADDITLQYSILAQAQNYPQADAEGSGVRYTGHALGSLFQMGTAANLSVHHNLYAHMKGRLPRVGTESGDLTDFNEGAYNDFRNNVFYNWFDTAGTGASGQASQNNFISNFYLAGPGGDDVTQLPGEDGIAGTLDDTAEVTPKDGGTDLFNGNGFRSRVYHEGNVKDTNKDGDPDDAVATDNLDYRLSNWQTEAFLQTPYRGVTDSAEDAFARVLQNAGAFGNVDTIDPGVVNVDARLRNEVHNGTGKILAWADDPFNDDPNEGTEWRALLALRADLTTGSAPFTRPAGWDTDRDGMPDPWELAHGLNPDAQDHNGDFDNDGYTNLEDYLNEIAAIPAPVVLQFTNANGNGRYEEIGNWTTGIWQPTRFDDAEINAGNVTVDSVGQHASTLVVGTDAAIPVRLDIHDGWLMVEQQLTIGVSATVELAGGELYTTALSKQPGGVFDLTGGTLHAGVVDFDLVNQGGTIAPGSSVGTTHVQGDLTLDDGTLDIEFASNRSGDFVRVDGTLTLGGALRIALLDDFTPNENVRLRIATASTVTGAFDSVTPGYAVEVIGPDVYVSRVPEPLVLVPAALVVAFTRRTSAGF